MAVEFLTSLSVSLRFTAYPKYPHESSFFLFGGRRICFPWNIIMTASLRIQTMSRKYRMFPHNLSPPEFLDVLVLRLPGCYISVPVFFFHRAVWCTYSAVGLWSFRSAVFTWSYELKIFAVHVLASYKSTNMWCVFYCLNTWIIYWNISTCRLKNTRPIGLMICNLYL
jgi:hypothetical protein